jgi:D-aminoacyl-tRNA deacylase
VIGLLQRVAHAQVAIAGDTVGAIGRGLLVFIAVEPRDTEAQARRLIERMAAYRVFADASERMNRSLADVGGELLLVSQFTLAADTGKGLRPSFTSAAPPELGRTLFEAVVAHAQAALPGKVATGRFGANMKVASSTTDPLHSGCGFTAPRVQPSEPR